MTLNTMLYSYQDKEVIYIPLSDDVRYELDLVFHELECNTIIYNKTDEAYLQDPNYLMWQIFDKILEC